MIMTQMVPLVPTGSLSLGRTREVLSRRLLRRNGRKSIRELRGLFERLRISLTTQLASLKQLDSDVDINVSHTISSSLSATAEQLEPWHRNPPMSRRIYPERSVSHDKMVQDILAGPMLPATVLSTLQVTNPQLVKFVSQLHNVRPKDGLTEYNGSGTRTEMLYVRIALEISVRQAPCSKCLQPLAFTFDRQEGSYDPFTGADVSNHTCLSTEAKERGHLLSLGPRVAFILDNYAGNMTCWLCKKIHHEKMVLSPVKFGKDDDTRLAVRVTCPRTNISAIFCLISSNRTSSSRKYRVPDFALLSTHLHEKYEHAIRSYTDAFYLCFGPNLCHPVLHL